MSTPTAKFRSRGGRRAVVAILVVLGCGPFLLPGRLGDIDRLQVWHGEAAYMARQEELGYRFYGWLGEQPAWPAIAVDRIDDDNGVRFTAPSGQVHQYLDFPGVRFKAVTFRPVLGAAGFVIVLGRPGAARF